MLIAYMQPIDPTQIDATFYNSKIIIGIPYYYKWKLLDGHRLY